MTDTSELSNNSGRVKERKGVEMGGTLKGNGGRHCCESLLSVYSPLFLYVIFIDFQQSQL